jgi:hypothetical protein
MRIEPNFWSEEFGVEHGLFGACASVEPAEIAKRERRKVVG